MNELLHVCTCAPRLPAHMKLPMCTHTYDYTKKPEHNFISMTTNFSYSNTTTEIVLFTPLSVTRFTRLLTRSHMFASCIVPYTIGNTSVRVVFLLSQQSHRETIVSVTARFTLTATVNTATMKGILARHLETHCRWWRKTKPVRSCLISIQFFSCPQGNAARCQTEQLLVSKV